MHSLSDGRDRLASGSRVGRDARGASQASFLERKFVVSGVSDRPQSRCDQTDGAHRRRERRLLGPVGSGDRLVSRFTTCNEVGMAGVCVQAESEGSAWAMIAIACLTATMRVVRLADRGLIMLRNVVLALVGLMGAVLRVDGEDMGRIAARVDTMMGVLGTSFVLNVAAAMICAMGQFLHVGNQ